MVQGNHTIPALEENDAEKENVRLKAEVVALKKEIDYLKNTYKALGSLFEKTFATLRSFHEAEKQQIEELEKELNQTKQLVLQVIAQISFKEPIEEFCEVSGARLGTAKIN